MLVGVSPAEQVAVVPSAGGYFEAERQTAGIKASDHHHGRNSEHIDPAGFAVRSLADASVLGHGFVRRRHLCSGINIAVEVEPVEALIE